MLILASIADKLQLVTSAAGNIDVHVSYLDNVAGSVAPGRQNTIINAAGTTDILAPPNSGVFRNLKTLHVYNQGPGSNTVTIIHTDGTTAVQIHETTLQPGQDLQYRDEAGFAFLFGSGGATTGDLKPTHKLTADPGWIMWTDGTIGDATSGASILADISTTALFALYYGYTDVQCPLLTATGVATTRAAQGTAGVAYAAHCRMTMPKAAGRALAMAGTGAGLTARAVGDNTGVEAQNPSLATMAPHSHGFIGGQDGAPNGPLGAGAYQNQNQNFQGPHGLEGLIMQNAGGGQPLPVMQPTAFVNVMVKL